MLKGVSSSISANNREGSLPTISSPSSKIEMEIYGLEG
jgi:hypothetical protein